MNNFPVIIQGKTYWISRAMAVACFVFTPINGKWHVLANRRGQNAPDFQGYWNAPCGYLDFDETLAQAAIREVYEETGIKLTKVKFWKFNDSPDENRQNVTARHYAVIADPQIRNMIASESSNRGGEVGEVSEVAWIPVMDIEEYQWAFGHGQIITDLFNELKLC